MRKILFCAVLFAALCSPMADAAPQTITATGIYVMGDNDSPKIARDAARGEAMRSAVEQAGVYVESYSKTQNYQLTADEVQMISGAVLKVVHESASPSLENGAWKYTVILTAEVDADAIDLKAMMEKRMELERLQKERDALKKQNEELLGRYERSSGAEKTAIGEQLENRYALDAIFDESVALIQRGEQRAAIQRLSEVIDTPAVKGSPLAYAYYLRGRAYYEMKAEQIALEDFKLAEFTPHDNAVYPVWRTHYFRGLIFYGRKQYEDAYQELKLAWEASDKTEQEIWEALQRADKKAHRTKHGMDWGKIITDVLIGAIKSGEKADTGEKSKS